MKNLQEQKHPSYGLLRFSRISGGNERLFGSSIKHRDKIMMEVFHGSVLKDEDLGTQNYYQNELILRAEMSYSQFAEAISAMNVGNGVPITLFMTEKNDHIEPCPFEYTTEEFRKYCKNHINSTYEDANKLIAETKEVFNQDRIKKADKEKILDMLNRLALNIGANMDYVASVFTDYMDDVVKQAKGEIEAFAENKIRSFGIEALNEKINTDSLLAIEERETE